MYAEASEKVPPKMSVRFSRRAVSLAMLLILYCNTAKVLIPNLLTTNASKGLPKVKGGFQLGHLLRQQ